MYAKRLSGNLWKITAIRMMRGFMVIMPVIVLFFQDNGLSMSEVFLLQSLFSVAVIVLEVPSGYLSDRFGRRNSIVVGSLLTALGYTIYSVGHGFFGFLCAEILIGFGASFISGADSALLYDSLEGLHRTPEYKRIEGRNGSLGMMSEGAASVIGGVIAVISLRFPMYCEAVVMWLIVPIALSLVEPDRKQLVARENLIADMLRLVRYALHDHAEIKWLSLYSSVVGASTLTMAWLIQPYLKEAGLPLGYFGVAWAALMSIGAFFSWHAHAVEAFLGKRNALLMLIGMPALGYTILGLSGTLSGAVGIVLFSVTRGVHNPVLSDYINGLVGSDIRATILSVKNLVGRVLFSIVGPIIGWMRDEYSLSLALLASGMIFLLLGGVAISGLSKAERR
jgi:MFS family permease